MSTSCRCLHCGEEVSGPALRFRHGYVKEKELSDGDMELKFVHDSFQDGEWVKWAHPHHLPRVLEVELEEDCCNLCNGDFAFEDNYMEWPIESLLYVEYGYLTNNGRVNFKVEAGGLAHFCCVVEDWDVPALMWLQSADAP